MLIVIPNYLVNRYRFPSLEIIKLLREMLKIKIILIFQDTYDLSYIEKRILPVHNKVDKIIVADDPDLKLTNYFEILKEKTIYYPYPSFPTQYIEKAIKLNKNIDVTFFGNISGADHFEPRKVIMDYLLKNKLIINGVSSDWSRSSSRWDYMEMLEFLKRSKIGLNFSFHSKTGIVNSRAIEIMASGALLIQNKIEPMHKFFIEGTDFIEFDSKEELLEKIQYFLKNDLERNQIASNGANKLLKLFNAESFLETLTKSV